jgi:hypothetical protein
MDPNANLDQQLDIAKRIQQLADSDEPLERFAEKLEALAEELADRVEALDHWLAGGGFLPARWQRKGQDNGN